MMNKHYHHYDDILNFLNTYEDWEERLSADFQIDTTWDGDYFLLKYRHLGVDWAERLVRECRGSIFRWDEGQNKYICVCAPFVKFFNAFEEWADEINWESTYTTEKVDGSLFKLWYDRGRWHLSTNGTINAWKATFGGGNFGSAFNRVIIENHGASIYSIAEREHWRKDATHMFELVSRDNRVCVWYDYEDIFYLGSRDMSTMEEYEDSNIGIRTPNYYTIDNLDKAKEIVSTFGAEKEGLVVRDKYYNRIKIKGEEYLRLARLYTNGPVTIRRVIEMIRENSLDDFKAYYPYKWPEVERILIEYLYIKAMMSGVIADVSKYFGKSKKEFAAVVNNLDKGIVRSFAFYKFDHPETTVDDFLDKSFISTLEKEIEKYLKESGDGRICNEEPI